MVRMPIERVPCPRPLGHVKHAGHTDEDARHATQTRVASGVFRFLNVNSPAFRANAAIRAIYRRPQRIAKMEYVSAIPPFTSLS
jgi:hypothetical protein